MDMPLGVYTHYHYDRLNREAKAAEKVPKINRFQSIPGTFLVETTGLEAVTSCV